MKTLVTLFFLTIVICCDAQRPSLNFKFAPLALIDEGTFPTISGGVEFPINKKMTIYSELGIRYRKGYYDNSDTSFVSSTGYKIKLEARYYLGSLGGHETDPRYFAANIFFGSSRHNDGLSYYYLRDTSQLRGDNFSSKKITWGFSVLYGTQQNLTKRLLLDMYVGLSIRLRHVNADHLEYDERRDSLATARHYNIDDIRAKVNSGSAGLVAPGVTLGLRICWKFKGR